MPSSTTSITRGAALTVLMRWCDRLIGVTSTLILARILVPDDFGIVAMASIVVAFVDITFDMGVSVALIQKTNPSQQFYNTAWTIKVLQGLCVAGMLVVAAPFAAEYYNDERVTAVIRVMALSVLVSSFDNVGIITFQKSLNFVADVKFIFVKRIVGFVITIILTVLFESYWGMVVGALCGRFVSMLASYYVHPMRPRFTLAHFGEIFSVSQWMLVKNVSSYLDRSAHIIVVGGVASTSVTGGYTLASEISAIPGQDLLAPINRVLFPAFARVKDDLAQLATLLVRAQGVQVMVTLPASVGFAMTANEIVPLALGVKWIFIIPFIQILALSNILQSINTSANYVLTVLGHFRLLALASWAQLCIFGMGVLLWYPAIDATLIAQVRLGAIALTFGISFAMLMRYMPQLSLRAMASGIIRPVVACAAMAGVIWLMQFPAVELPLWATLASKVCIGAFTYTVCILTLWHLFGRPDGAERYFVDKLSRKV